MSRKSQRNAGLSQGLFGRRLSTAADDNVLHARAGDCLQAGSDHWMICGNGNGNFSSISVVSERNSNSEYLTATLNKFFEVPVDDGLCAMKYWFQGDFCTNEGLERLSDDQRLLCDFQTPQTSPLPT